MELEIGDTVVVPVMGVGTVDANEEVDVGDGTVTAYRIDMGPDDGTFWIPEAQLGSQGLRPPITEAQLPLMWSTLAEQTSPEKRENWNRRRRRYDEMLASNEPLQLAALIGELMAVQADKAGKKQSLSFGERQLLDKTHALLAAEVSFTTGRPLPEIMTEITQRSPGGDA